MPNLGFKFDFVSMIFWGEPRHPLLDFIEK